MRLSMSFRLPTATIDQIRALASRCGMTLTQVVIVAIDRMASRGAK